MKIDKVKSTWISLYLAYMFGVVSVFSQASILKWLPYENGVPDSVAKSLSMEFNINENQVTAKYALELPHAGYRVAQFGPVVINGSVLNCELSLEYLAGGAAIQVITPVSGSLDFGGLVSGNYTVCATSNGKVLRQFSLTVPGVSQYPMAQFQEGKPYITSIQLMDKEVKVNVYVPNGVKKITLESRTRFGNGTWVPRLVERVEIAGYLSFRLPKSDKLEVLRIRGDSQEALPKSFYEGQTEFNGQASTYNTIYYGGAEDMRNTVPGAPTTDTSKSREVVESDIWKIQGNTLYFFNQYRGLQIIDLTQPDKPVIKSSLDLPASGEQMYVMGDRYVVLLARNYSSDGSQVHIVDVSAQPQIVASIPVEGTLQESRMVGTALYVAAQVYRQITVNKEPADATGTRSVVYWEYGSAVTSIDLENPANPVKKNSTWYSGYGNVISATERYLLVAYQVPNSTYSKVEIVDITDPNGTMKTLGTIAAAGRIADKFKMNISEYELYGDVLTVVSEYFGGWGTATSQRKSVLETFSLADPAAPRKLANLEVGHGESLYATRFDGDRVYIVTFLRIDPLWVVDLKDPAKPVISGELEVPGYSTYIQPLGDRLVTIGIDNSNSWKVAVSLFDVTNPSRPGLLAKVPLGENSSWSEANNDEKAFSVLPDAGLIMVPYQGWGSNNWASRVQLIDLGKDTLKARGVIEHEMQPRRSALYQDRIVSISGRELLVVNASDRDKPITTGMLELSWSVDRLFVVNDYLVEISAGNSWYYNESKPSFRITKQSNPNEIINKYGFANGLPIVGAAKQGSKIYVMQGNAYGYVGYLKTADEVANDSKSSFVFSIYDASNLPEIKQLSELKIPATNTWYGSFNPVWPKDDLLVWVTSGGGYYRGLYMLDIMPGRYYWGGSGGEMIAFNVAESTSPKLDSTLSLSSTNGYWNYSTAYSANGMIYISHQASEFIPDVLLPGQAKPQPVITVDDKGNRITNYPPVGIYVSKYWLDVVDYADSTTPVIRPSINIPGQLIGVSHQGALLYTLGYHWDDNWKSDYTQFLDISAYDGVKASLVSSLKLIQSWPQPLIGSDGLVYLTQSTTNNTGQLEIWQLQDTAKLVRLKVVDTPATISSLRQWSSLMAVQMNYQIQLFNTTSWSMVGGSKSAGYVWPDLSLADGEVGRGVWIPTGDYGVFSVPVSGKP